MTDIGCNKFQRPLGSEYGLCQGCQVGSVKDENISSLPFSVESGGRGPVPNCTYMSDIDYSHSDSVNMKPLEFKITNERGVIDDRVVIKYLQVIDHGHRYEIYGLTKKEGPYEFMPLSAILNQFELKESMRSSDWPDNRKIFVNINK